MLFWIENEKVSYSALSDRRLEHLVEIINQIVSKDNIYLGEIQKKENELKENISCLSHDLRTPLTSIRGYLQLLSSAPDEKRAEYISALSGKALRLERLIDDFLSNLSFRSRTISILLWKGWAMLIAYWNPARQLFDFQR